MVFSGYFDMEGEEEQGTASMLTPGFLAWVAGHVTVPLTRGEGTEQECFNLRTQSDIQGGTAIQKVALWPKMVFLPLSLFSTISKQQVATVTMSVSEIS